MHNMVLVNGMRGLFRWLLPAVRHNWRVNWRASVSPGDVVFQTMDGKPSEAPTWAVKILRAGKYERVETPRSDDRLVDGRIQSRHEMAKHQTYRSQGYLVYFTTE